MKIVIKSMMLDFIRFQRYLKRKTGVSLTECWRAAQKQHLQETCIFPPPTGMEKVLADLAYEHDLAAKLEADDITLPRRDMLDRLATTGERPWPVHQPEED
jgi:hypothetical protein